MGLWKKIRENKFILGILIFDILAIILLIAFNIISSFRSAVVEISVVPVDSKIKINGKTYDNNSTYTLFPKNNAKVEISYDGLESQSFNVDLERKSINVIHKYLIDKEKGLDYYLSDDKEEDLDALEKLADLLPKDKKLQEFTSKTRIRSILPLSREECGNEADRDSCFSIFINAGYYRDCGNKFCIAISDSSATRHQEIYEQMMKNVGYDLSDFKVIHESKSIKYIQENPS